MEEIDVLKKLSKMVETTRLALETSDETKARYYFYALKAIYQNQLDELINILNKNIFDPNAIHDYIDKSILKNGGYYDRLKQLQWKLKWDHYNTELLINNFDSLLFAAVSCNNVEAIRCLVLKFKVDPNFVLAQDTGHSKHIPAVCRAAHHGRMEALKVLIEECGADPKQTSKDGLTALHYALARCLKPENSKENYEEEFSIRKKIAYYLINECGLSVTQTTNEGVTVAGKLLIRILLYKRDLNEFRELAQEFKLNPVLLTKKGSLLHLLCSYIGRHNFTILPDAVKFILSTYKIDINAIDESKSTALILVAKSLQGWHEDYKRYQFEDYSTRIQECIGIIRILMQYGANTSVMDAKGLTALDYLPKEEAYSNLRELFSENTKKLPVSSLSTNIPSLEIDQKKLPYEISVTDIIFQDKLGSGAFGVVYKGVWQHNFVAIKQLSAIKLSQDAEREFQQETQLMTELRSPNVVQFYGVCYYQKSPCIVMEYMEQGSLFNFLRVEQPQSWNIRLEISRDISKGVAYLHSTNIIHRDLKSLNVLLDNQNHAKLCDFGLAKVKSTLLTSTQDHQVVGTLAWLAPELFQRNSVYSFQSDMYSLGMVLWEIAARKIPFSDAQGKQELIIQWISMGEREKIPHDTPKNINDLIEQCWDAEPMKRPSAAQAVEALLKTQGFFSQNANTKNPNLNLASQPSYRGNLDSQDPNQNSGENYYNNFKG